MRVLKIWGVGYLILVLVLAIVMMMVHRNYGFIEDYKNISKANGQTIGDIC
jgi:hypothetical protein